MSKKSLKEQEQEMKWQTIFTRCDRKDLSSAMEFKARCISPRGESNLGFIVIDKVPSLVIREKDTKQQNHQGE